jgi:hypothetical protein
MGIRLYKHRHGIHITVGNVMLDVIYVAVVDCNKNSYGILACIPRKTYENMIYGL